MLEHKGSFPSGRDFSAQLNTSFLTELGDGRDVELHLDKFEELVSTESHENFSLLFRAPVDAPSEQNTYTLKHESLGTLDIFLVPVKKDAHGLYYEAVFNLFSEPAAAAN